MCQIIESVMEAIFFSDPTRLFICKRLVRQICLRRTLRVDYASMMCFTDTPNKIEVDVSTPTRHTLKIMAVCATRQGFLLESALSDKCP